MLGNCALIDFLRNFLLVMMTSLESPDFFDLHEPLSIQASVQSTTLSHNEVYKFHIRGLD